MESTKVCAKIGQISHRKAFRLYRIHVFSAQVRRFVQFDAFCQVCLSTQTNLACMLAVVASWSPNNPNATSTVCLNCTRDLMNNL